MKLGWILIGNEDVPSSRIMALNVLNYMNYTQMSENVVLWKPDRYDPYVGAITYPLDLDYAVFQKTCLGHAEAIMKSMQMDGIKTIYIVDDLIQEAIPMCKIADIVITGSYFLYNFVKEATGRSSIIIPDAYETPQEMCKEAYNSDKIRVIWYGTIGHFQQALELKPLVQSMGYEYFTVTRHPDASRQWHLSTIWYDIMESDIVVIPFLGELPPYEKAKGNNRLTQAMVLGMPVIASPIPEYCKIIDQFKTGILAYDNTKDAWKEYLEYLGDWKVREEMGKAARAQVKNIFHISNVAKVWMEMLNEDQARSFAKSRK